MTNQHTFFRSLAICGPLLVCCSQSPGETIPGPLSGPGSASPPSPPSLPGDPNGDNVATDIRPAVEAATPPPPISGGNLLVTRDGRLIVVADSDRDRLVVVADETKKIVADIPLSPGDEPGRMIEDAAGRVHVALRRGGALVTLDPLSLSIVERRAVCEGPRGVAADDAHGNVIVACADGKLVTLPSAGGPASASVFIGPDLRDVMVNDSGLWVSTFKSAKLLRVDAGGVVGATFGLPQLTGNVAAFHTTTAQFQPEVAWRTAALGGKVVMLHQAAQLDAIELVEPTDAGSPAKPPGSASPNGGGDPCGGVVRAAFSSIDAKGIVHTSAALGAGTLPVDFDVASNGAVAIAFAGSGGSSGDGGKFSSSPQSFALFQPGTLSSGPADLGGSGAGGDGASAGGAAYSSGIEETGNTTAFPDCVTSDTLASIAQPVVAVRFNPVGNDELFLLARSPARLYTVSIKDPSMPFAVDLGGADVTDTGHELFHTDAGRGIACASCHPEGGEDGHVWTFSGQGARRTQALTAGLAHTAPFHWDGALENVGAVMDEVFVKRMGGLHQSPERVAGLEHWLFSLVPPPALRASDDAAAQRGAALFASAETACSTCHSGPALTNNLSVLVGTSAQVKLQVPSLLGIGQRAPFMHTGCAATLLDRFDPACGGGESHGHTAQLSLTQVADLTAYLETL